MLKLLFVGIGGFLGAISRFLVGQYLNVWFPHFPVATLVVNVLGSFFIGFVLYGLFTGAAIPENLKAFLVAGFLGSLTTMSTFSFDTFRLFELKEVLLAAINLCLTVILCLLAVYVGRLVAFWYF